MPKTDLKDYIIEQLEEMKIEEIITIDTSKTTSIADWVIIGSGRSGKQIESAMENLRINLKSKGCTDCQINGTANDGWIIYDLGNIIVHLFVPAVRDIYKLEELFKPKTKKVATKEKKPTIKKKIQTKTKK